MIKCESQNELYNHVEIDGEAGPIVGETLSIIQFLKDTLSNDPQTKLLYQMFRRDVAEMLGFRKRRN